MKIAVLSRGRTLYSTRRIAETGRKRKHDVRVIDPTRASIKILPEGLELSVDGLKLEGFDAVIPRVGSSSMETSLHVLRQFELCGTTPLNTSQAIYLSKDKLAAQQVLAVHGINTPRSAICRDPSAIAQLIEDVGGAPVVIKVTRGTHGSGVVVAESTNSALSVLETIWGFQSEALIQEFIKESSGSDIRVFVVGDRAVGAMQRQAAEGEFRANLHLGGTGEVVELSDELAELALKATQALGLSIAGVDILLSHRGPLVLEVNASPGLQGIETATGLDIAKDIIKLAEEMV